MTHVKGRDIMPLTQETSRKISGHKVKAIGRPEDRTLRFIISDETPDRDNDIINVEGWDFDDYAKNPVMLLNHDYWCLPIAKCVGWNIDRIKRQVTADFKFPTVAELCTDPKIPSEQAQTADTVYCAYVNGYLSAVSVGFVDTESKERDDPEAMENESWLRGRYFTGQELLEVSAVTVPANPNAVQQRMAKSFDPKQREIMTKLMKPTTKGAIPFKHYPLADEADAWDAGAAVKGADTDDLKIMSAWYDSENADVKGSYKLPHHLGNADGYKTVWKGVAAAMAALLGSRGGVDIPEGDQEKTYNHLKKHYAEFGKEPPEFGKAYTEAELKNISQDKEGQNMTAQELQSVVDAAVAKALQARHTKSGAKISAETADHIQKGMDMVTKAIDGHKEALKGLQAATEHLKALVPDSGVATQGTESSSGDAGTLPQANPQNEGSGAAGTGDGKAIDLSSLNIKDFQ